LGHSAFLPPFGIHDGLEIHPISKRVTFQLEKQANNRDLKKKMDINVSYGSFPLSFGSKKLGDSPAKILGRGSVADLLQLVPLNLPAWPWGDPLTMGQFQYEVMVQLPSGYVKIAIENGHRNSELSH